MRIFALELNNDIKGLEERKHYIESLISQLPSPDLVLLPELAIPSYMPNQKIWEYADQSSQDTSVWAIEIAKKFNIFIGVGYVDYKDGDYYNRYLIANKKQVYGVVTKSEGEAAVFKRGKYNNIIKTPFGNVGVAICYDSRRKHFYESIKNEKISLIVFPHGSPANPKKDDEETKTNDYFCNLYKDAFKVPVIYVNSVGKLEYMPGIMGKLMKKLKFTMNGKTKIYTKESVKITSDLKEAVGYEINLSEQKRKKDIIFYGDNLIKENTFFRHFILKPDILIGIRQYNKSIKNRLL
ncbi:MAG: carbon-nitrogen hydrolase family protein [Erysipelotrichia bacterium]|jgi:predicted amidohydrolase|nr:carbon-nitrogen hydrolase family protein [Erysipelotrichia bacterium]